MSLLHKINALSITARNNGHSGLFSNADFSLMLMVNRDKELSRLLYRSVKAGILKKICRDVFVNPLAMPEPNGILVSIAKKLHWNQFLYISLESQLSYTGDISQILFDYLTVMTTGRSGKVETPYGVIEFTHTKRDLKLIEDDFYYDDDIGIYRAKTSRAKEDLYAVGRNVEMLLEVDTND